MRQIQQEMRFSRRGGRRRGAGRKPKEGSAGVPHLRRPELKRRFPVHVTLRVRQHVWNLRSRRSFAAVRRAFYAGRERFGFRLIEFSVQGNHFHLIVEAENEVALSRGVQGMAIRIAKALNRMMTRRGRVFADRYHAHILRTPSEVRRARDYVIENARKHHGVRGVDEYSSAFGHAELVVAAATWLLSQAARTPSRAGSESAPKPS